MKDEYKTLSDAQRTKLGNKYDPINLFRETYNYDVWFENVELTDTTWRKSDEKESVDLSDMLPLEGDEKLKEETRLKILTLNKLWTRLPMLLAQIKTRNNSYKLRNKIRANTVSFLSAQWNHYKFLHQFN